MTQTLRPCENMEIIESIKYLITLLCYIIFNGKKWNGWNVSSPIIAFIFIVMLSLWIFLAKKMQAILKYFSQNKILLQVYCSIFVSRRNESICNVYQARKPICTTDYIIYHQPLSLFHQSCCESIFSYIFIL